MKATSLSPHTPLDLAPFTLASALVLTNSRAGLGRFQLSLSRAKSGQERDPKAQEAGPALGGSSSGSMGVLLTHLQLV